jgi:hypothetical protein
VLDQSAVQLNLDCIPAILAKRGRGMRPGWQKDPVFPVLAALLIPECCQQPRGGIQAFGTHEQIHVAHGSFTRPVYAHPMQCRSLQCDEPDPLAPRSGIDECQQVRDAGVAACYMSPLLVKECCPAFRSAPSQAASQDR